MKRLFLSLAALVTLAGVSCKKNFLDINDNPNNATAITPQLAIPSALEDAAREQQTRYLQFAFWTGYWATSSGFAKPVATYTYDINSSFGAGTWDALYDNLSDWNYIEQSAVEKKFPVYQGIAKVMKAYDFHQLVDLWGNVPYSEALVGAKALTPKYDDQKTIYEDLVKQLDSAILIFSKPATANSVSIATDKAKILLFGSILSAGDPAGSSDAFLKRWTKFANSLKLKLLMNQSQIPGRDVYIKQELNGLTAANFLALGEDAVLNPGYLASTGKLSPFFGTFYTSPTKAGDNFNSIRASDYGAKAYLNAADTFRISYFYTKPAAASTYLGSVFGDPTGTANAATVGGGTVVGNRGLLDPTGNAIIFTAAESLFLQAEAVQRGYITGNAKQLFLDGVLSSFQFTKVPNATAAFTTYTTQANPLTNWDLATDKIAIIIQQKWYALNGIDILSSYNDYRRLGLPNVPLSTDPASKGKVPLRLFYPQREITTNGPNVTAQGNIDVFTTPIFWDK
jgi:hypothetical protein